MNEDLKMRIFMVLFSIITLAAFALSGYGEHKKTIAKPVISYINTMDTQTGISMMEKETFKCKL